MKIYSTARAAPTPALNAIATLILVASFLVVIVGWLAWRRWGRDRGDDAGGGLGAIASM
jgi:spermidine/putrescine transport system permease protein